MANSGKRHTNTSQFFITLDKADELTNKHTMFGKITGNTIFSVFPSLHTRVGLAEGGRCAEYWEFGSGWSGSAVDVRIWYNLLDAADLGIASHPLLLDSANPVPLFTGISLRLPSRPPKIRGIRIIENPFDDIVPRITVSEKKAQIQARIEAKKDAEQREKRSRAKK
jgi:peptidyl-prolyl cis-trans isomerase SDCCAG10